ncbi:hypothetical protein PV387_10425 [Streptomyces sp. ME02-6987-2C]|uniref:hypothetical protein n=1 Tax=unclassified Streptomyces TaxID=2593676 RepID=UPI0008796166|nr:MULTISPECIES: hypothetical protein [unclassified Streptomyces]MDX3366442.1 hypothetical protein [Streptomyces sp. ME02-6987-2C]MDX3423735.1 hypothetical protein [Streptomyces sp. ME02-6985-2c]REH20633.1 hypothetical protein BX268_2417 [Streptomyces sp. 2221.1]SDT30808.1 hypothetical protein SAMN05428941_2412 [Streptomyces sp. 2114.2]
MNPIRIGRTVLFFLPYVLVVSGLLAASKIAGAPGGTGVVFQALGVTAVGALWAWRRGRRHGY